MTPSKGDGTVHVMQGTSKFVGKDIVTTYKIKNTSTAPIALLKVDEDLVRQGQDGVVDTQRYRQPFRPGEIIEITTKSPAARHPPSSQDHVLHANGKVKPSRVKAILTISARSSVPRTRRRSASSIAGV